MLSVARKPGEAGSSIPLLIRVIPAFFAWPEARDSGAKSRFRTHPLLPDR